MTRYRGLDTKKNVKLLGEVSRGVLEKHPPLCF